MSAAESALYFLGRLLVRCFYRVTALGLENIPAGGFLLLPNHITWVDAIVLQLACSRPIRYVIDQEHYYKPILHPILRTLGCVPIILAIRVPLFALRRKKLLRARSSVCFQRASWSAPGFFCDCNAVTN